jgi:predicted nucleotidyltransferase component of viral defense system
VSAEADRVYRELQRLARETGRGTQELLELYVHERFLARLARSPYSDRFVLKGGMLLTVLDVRRATRDADLLARALSNEPEAMEAVIAEIASSEDNDGLEFDIASVTSESIREDGAYGGLRIKMPVALSTAKLRLQVDVSVGDPVQPQRIDYVELLGGEFTLLGYPIEQSLAEKIETMVARANANTRDRDWGDVYLLSKRHEIPARELGDALDATASHRGHDLAPLAEVIDSLPELRQEPWTAHRTRAGLDTVTPESFREVVDAVIAFADPILAGRRTGIWDPRSQEWCDS